VPDEAADEETAGRPLPSVPDVRVLVVVPTLNEVRHITTVARSVLSGARPFRSCRLVISDGGSTDGTQDVARALAADNQLVACIDNALRLQSAGVNRAVEQFGHEADVLIRCDAHATYPDDFCVRLVETLVREKADAVVVPLDTVGRTPLERALAWACGSPIGTGGSAHRGGRRSGLVDHGHHAAFRLDTFCRVGGYDESFSHNEDAEFDCRQRKMGARIWLDANARITYYPRDTWRGLVQQYFRYGAGRARTLRRHPMSIRLRQLLVPLNFLGCLVALALSRRWSWALAWPVSYASALVAISLVLAWRHRSVDGLLVGLAAGVMHTAWAVGLIEGLLRSQDRAWTPQGVTTLRLKRPEEAV
jgi:succinoglycan biosynthesis protein ExoA